ncbi:hypothetical protein NKI50_23070 [Mesorhizobium sp. M0563]
MLSVPPLCALALVAKAKIKAANTARIAHFILALPQLICTKVSLQERSKQLAGGARSGAGAKIEEITPKVKS